MANVVTFSDLAPYVKTGKRDLLRFLADQGIEAYVRKRAVVFEARLCEDLPRLTVSFTFYLSHDMRIILPYETPEERKAYFDVLYHELIDSFGAPTSDNSHHHLDHAHVSWSREIGISLDIVDSSPGILIRMENFDNRRVAARGYRLSLILGLGWGIAMYLSVGIKYGPDWKIAVLWLIGGIFWGFLFKATQDFFGRRRKPRKLNSHSFRGREIQKIEDFQKQNGLGPESSVRCISWRRSPNVGRYPRDISARTSIHFFPDRVAFLFFRHGKMVRQDVESSEVREYSVGERNIRLSFGKHPPIYLESVQNPEVLEHNLNRLLRMDEDLLASTADIINRCFLEYDMYGSIKGGAPLDFYKADARNIALSLGPDPRNRTHTELVNRLMSAFFQDHDPFGDWEALARNIEKRLQESGSTTGDPAA